MVVVHETYAVQIWNLETRQGVRRTTYRLRWLVGGERFSETFHNRKLADSFRSELKYAANKGDPFDPRTGRPVTKRPDTVDQRTWLELAREYLDDRWPDFSPRHRKSTAEGLVTLTCALVESSRALPELKAIRRALMLWEFNLSARTRDKHPPSDYAAALTAIRDQSMPLARLSEPDTIRSALRAISLNLDGTKASASTTARKRAALSGALNFAVESGYLSHTPLRDVRRRREPANDVVDPRVVVNPEQARALLAAVDDIAPDLTAYFATLYYAAARPAESRNLRRSNLTLPNEGWGRILLTGGYQEAGAAWTDHGQPGEERQLKHRPRNAVRPTPAHPELVVILRRHLQRYQTGSKDRLFLARTGRGGRPLALPHTEPVDTSRIYNVWAKARVAAFTPEQVDSPLAARPYDLRHAAVSTWLDAGVAPTQVAEWAGHSVDVLLRVYAKCIDNTEQVALSRIEAAMGDAEKPRQRGRQGDDSGYGERSGSP